MEFEIVSGKKKNKTNIWTWRARNVYFNPFTPKSDQFKIYVLRTQPCFGMNFLRSDKIEGAALLRLWSSAVH